ncbi:glycerophosphodiester phosphodiesterase [Patescibacteria group bacterium]
MAKIIVAHRGGKEFFHENTLDAFKKAITIGAPYFELDIRQTKDKKVVCFHDPEIQNQKVEDLNFKELIDLSGIDVPLFEDVLKLTKGKIKLLCEIKEENYEKETIKQIRAHYNIDDVIVVSFKEGILIKIHKQDPKIKTGLIIGKRNFDKIFKIKHCGAKYLMLSFIYIKLKIPFIAKLFGIKVFTWTVNDPELIVKYIKDKNIFGIITDEPQKALKLLAASSNRK